MSNYTANLTPHVYNVALEQVSDGDYDTPVGNIYEPLPFMLDGSYFVDGSGNLVTPSAGTVTVSVSTDGKLFREIFNGTFGANDDPKTITPPNGQAPVTVVRVNLAGVVGAVGFRAKFVKGGE